MEMPPLDPMWDTWLKRFWYTGLAFWALFAVMVLAQNL